LVGGGGDQLSAAGDAVEERHQVERADIAFLENAKAVPEGQHHGDEEKHADMGPVDLPNPVADPRSAQRPACAIKRPPKGDGRGHP